MNRTFASGLGLTTLGVVGYLVGVSVPYPGRAFSITGIMVGVTLVAIAGTSDPEEGR